MDIEAMVGELKSRGPDTDSATVSALLEREEESFFHLALFATSRDSWDTTAVHPWSTFCALGILARMGHYRALLAITTAMLCYAKYAEDWLIEDAPCLLAHMGTDAIGPVTALMRHRDGHKLVRTGAVNALLMIGVNNPEARGRIVESVKKCAMAEPDVGMRDEILGHLFYLNDPAVHRYIDDLVRSGIATEMCYDLYDFCRLADGSMDFGVFLERAADPLYCFELWRGRIPPALQKPGDRTRSTSHPSPKRARRKAGRNDPCECGSGLKYKKCCMKRSGQEQ